MSPLHLFTGQLLLDEGGLDVYHYKARAYDPRLGRFLQQDPSHPLAVDTNLYRYVLNNPTNYIDSTGKIFETVWDLANVAMDAASLARNISNGDFAAAAVDAGALLLDGAAVVVPGVPGGAGAVVKAARGADSAVDAMKGVERAAEATKAVGNATDAARSVQKAAPAVARGLDTLTVRPDIVLSGGRSGQRVKNLTGPANSVLRGGTDRAFVTNDKGQVILDITKNRVKPVTPGHGFGPKRAPTQEELDILQKVVGSGS